MDGSERIKVTTVTLAKGCAKQSRGATGFFPQSQAEPGRKQQIPRRNHHERKTDPSHRNALHTVDRSRLRPGDRPDDLGAEEQPTGAHRPGRPQRPTDRARNPQSGAQGIQREPRGACDAPRRRRPPDRAGQGGVDAPAEQYFAFNFQRQAQRSGALGRERWQSPAGSPAGSAIWDEG